MNQRFATTLYGQNLMDYLPMSALQKQYLNYLDVDEIDCQVQVQFTTPVNVIDYNSTIYLTGAAGNLLYSIPLQMQGQYYSQPAYAGQIVLALNAFMTANGRTEIFTADANITYTNKFILQISDTTTIKGMLVKDQKLATILGINTLSKIYLFNNNFPAGSNLSLNTCMIGDIKMYINLHRQLNLYCSQMSVPGLTATDQNMFIISRLAYMFQPGQLIEISQNFPVSFMTTNLANGIQINMLDENGVQIDLENQNYMVSIQAVPSQNASIREQIVNSIKQQVQQKIQQEQEQKASMISQIKQQISELNQKKQMALLEELNEPKKEIHEEIEELNMEQQQLEEQLIKVDQPKIQQDYVEELTKIQNNVEQIHQLVKEPHLENKEQFKQLEIEEQKRFDELNNMGLQKYQAVMQPYEEQKSDLETIQDQMDNQIQNMLLKATLQLKSQAGQFPKQESHKLGEDKVKQITKDFLK